MSNCCTKNIKTTSHLCTINIKQWIMNNEWISKSNESSLNKTQKMLYWFAIHRVIAAQNKHTKQWVIAAPNTRKTMSHCCTKHLKNNESLLHQRLKKQWVIAAPKTQKTISHCCTKHANTTSQQVSSAPNPQKQQVI